MRIEKAKYILSVHRINLEEFTPYFQMRELDEESLPNMPRKLLLEAIDTLLDFKKIDSEEEVAHTVISNFIDNAKNGNYIFGDFFIDALKLLIRYEEKSTSDYYECAAPSIKINVDCSEFEPEKTIDLDWDCLPKWADKWIAMDNNGSWYSYSEKPFLSKDSSLWLLEEQQVVFINKFFTHKNFKGDWKDSLFMNPKYK